MKIFSLLTVAAFALLVVVRGDSDSSDEDVLEDAQALLEKLNAELQSQSTEYLDELWKMETNFTTESQILMNSNADLMFEYEDGDLAWDRISDPDTIRQAQLFDVFKKSNTPSAADKEELEDTLDSMLEVYYNVTLCKYKDPTECNYFSDDDFGPILSKENDPEEQLYYWTSYIDSVGPDLKPMFEKYVGLGNKLSKLDGYASKAEDWLSDFEQPADEIEKNLAEVIETIKPLYAEMHAYIRNKLNALYGDKVVPKTGPIPAYLLGSFTSSDFTTVPVDYLPYPESTTQVDYDDAIQNQDYSPLKIFKNAESFLVGLGLKPMTSTFWEQSMIEEPTDTVSTCVPDAWDFYRTDDFRILHCTTPTVDSVYTVQELMFIVEYYMAYANLPVIYRTAPLDGFSDALVLAIRHSTGNIRHLQKVGYIQKLSPDQDQIEKNHLFQMALSKVSYLSYTYQLDTYRKNIFRGEITSDKYNAGYWDIRKSIGGVAAPPDRTESNFDAAADNDVVTDVSLQSDFTSIVLQFQIFQDLCIAAGEFDPKNPDKKPLYKCDFTGSKKVGEKLTAIMSKGRSVPWYKALEAGIGANKLDATPLLNYFLPVYNWLQAENKKNGVVAGWQ